MPIRLHIYMYWAFIFRENWIFLTPSLSPLFLLFSFSISPIFGCHSVPKNVIVSGLVPLYLYDLKTTTANLHAHFVCFQVNLHLHLGVTFFFQKLIYCSMQTKTTFSGISFKQWVQYWRYSLFLILFFHHLFILFSYSWMFSWKLWISAIIANCRIWRGKKKQKKRNKQKQ